MVMVMTYCLTFLTFDPTNCTQIQLKMSGLTLRLTIDPRRGEKVHIMDQFLQEFQWRWNNRKQGLNDYNDLIAEIAVHYPL